MFCKESYQRVLNIFKARKQDLNGGSIRGENFVITA